MMPSNHIPSTRVRLDPTWKTLVEFTLPSRPGSDYVAREQIGTAVQALKLSATDLERLNTAVAKATLNAVNHVNSPQPEAPIVIRVLVAEQVTAMRQTDPGSGLCSDPQIPDLPAQVSKQQSPRSWGFFLIRKRVDEKRLRPDEAHYIIELFLYLESD